MWGLLKGCKSFKKIINDIERRKLLKCGYEIALHSKDKLVLSIFTNESVRERIEDEIASEAKLSKEDVAIDIPSLPSERALQKPLQNRWTSP